MSTTPKAAVCGMFLYEGYRDYIADRNPIDGAVEQAQALSQIAEFVADQTDLWIEDHMLRPVDYPGVLEYEVWNALGWRIAELSESRANHSAGWLYDRPRWDTVTEALHPLLERFFSQFKEAKA